MMFSRGERGKEGRGEGSTDARASFVAKSNGTFQPHANSIDSRIPRTTWIHPANEPHQRTREEIFVRHRAARHAN